VHAPPGSGKTTRIPLALLDSPWLGSNKILMLEPRRLAARAAAEVMDQLIEMDRFGFSVRAALWSEAAMKRIKGIST